MVVFVFAYVLVMKILYKLSRLAADWVRSLILCLGFVRRSFYFEFFWSFSLKLNGRLRVLQLVYNPDRPLKNWIIVVGHVGLNLASTSQIIFYPETFFSGYSDFSLSLKTSISKFLFCSESGRNQVDEEPLSRCAAFKSLFLYLIILIYLFI